MHGAVMLISDTELLLPFMNGPIWIAGALAKRTKPLVRLLPLVYSPAPTQLENAIARSAGPLIRFPGADFGAGWRILVCGAGRGGGGRGAAAGGDAAC